MYFIFIDSLYIWTQLLFYLVIHRIIYPCARNLFHIAVALFLLQLIYIACSGYIRLSVYMWGILLAYIRCRLLWRLCSSVFWEAGRDILFAIKDNDMLLV